MQINEIRALLYEQIQSNFVITFLNRIEQV